VKRTEFKVDPERARAQQQAARERRQAKVEAARNESPPGMRWTGFRWVPDDAPKAVKVEKAKRSKRTSKKDSPELVAAKAERRLISNDVCEVDGCGDKAEHFHHAWLRSQGGPDLWWNLRHICRPHHEFIHANPEDSYRKGLMLRRSDGLAEQKRRADELAALIEGSAA
jgi:hypothetical protein